MYVIHHGVYDFTVRSLKMDPVGTESIWEKFDAFLNLFNPKIKCFYRDLNESKTALEFIVCSID